MWCSQFHDGPSAKEIGKQREHCTPRGVLPWLAALDRAAAQALPTYFPEGGPISEAYSEYMRIAIAVIGVIVALFGLLWALQGFGVVGGSPMSNTTTWSIIGPIVALIGIALVVGALRRKS